ncbi:hypothetical protein AV530_002545 [Patagioenas fasciata monilis]|uniref:Secreted protein n=1 Tax=Patagioenas fasciata monilis TaxID=372326 RepID=A0A1V4K6R3_PATFA|nr:hypothetical protein AV530_002545 [Patagioenas fasciata monilis]
MKFILSLLFSDTLIVHFTLAYVVDVWLEEIIWKGSCGKSLIFCVGRRFSSQSEWHVGTLMTWTSAKDLKFSHI